MWRCGGENQVRLLNNIAPIWLRHPDPKSKASNQQLERKKGPPSSYYKFEAACSE
jgi:hypothetical protein